MVLTYNGYEYESYRVDGGIVYLTVRNKTTGDAFSMTEQLSVIKAYATALAAKTAIIAKIKKAIDDRIALLATITAQKTTDATEETAIASKLAL